MLKHNKTLKVTAFILCVCVFVIIILSELYISKNLQHNCTGEHCAICHEILLAENYIHQICSGIISIFLFAITTVIIKRIIVVVSVLISNRSLISEKIRLNN